MSKKNVTIEGLAVMVKKGFDDMGKRFDETAKEKDLNEIKERVENIEKMLLKQHTFEIQELKKRVRRIEDLFALK